MRKDNVSDRISENEVRRKKDVLIENLEKEFEKITTILEELGCEVVMTFDEVSGIRGNYNARVEVTKEFGQKFKDEVGKVIEPYLGEDYLWVIDICWIEFADRATADRYGIRFLDDFPIKKYILISSEFSDRYKLDIAGIKFVCKKDPSGKAFSDYFKNNLENELASLRTDNYTNQPGHGENSPY